jgi:hypothetical protein
MHSTNSVFLVKPANFGYNAETAKSNAFQNQLKEAPELSTKKALQEFEEMAQKLLSKGIEVTVIEDTLHPIKPDAIFPNNWGSFHADGTIVLYPMLARNRRTEKRKEILETIAEGFEVKQLIDLSFNEAQDIFLEGTGSIIFDHTSKKAYACLAPRTNKELLLKTANTLGYEAVYFNAYDKKGKAIYHTNVMMNIGNGYAVICLDSITDASEKQLVTDALKHSGKKIVNISYDQMASFCGNMIELEIQGAKNILAMSQSAFNGLTAAQKDTLETFCELFPLKVDTIERIGGGSVRCMISEIFLPKRNESKTE